MSEVRYIEDNFIEVPQEVFYEVLYKHDEDIIRYMSPDKGCYDIEWRIRINGKVFGYTVIDHKKALIDKTFYLHKDVYSK